MSAPENRAQAAKTAQIARKGVKNSSKTRAKWLQLRHLKKPPGSTYESELFRTSLSCRKH